MVLPSTAFSIYPNPSTTGTFAVEANIDIADAEIHIFNTLGQPIAKKELQSGRNTFTLPATGIYFVSISKNGKTILTEKVIFVGN